MIQSERLAGWGRTAPVTVHRRYGTTDSVPKVIGASDEMWLARGMGRAYGDAAVLAGGNVVSLSDDRLIIDEDSGCAVCSADVTIDRVIAAAVPRGYFVPVTPGTRLVSVGGAVAADIHGKNHHHDGTFGDHVRWIRLVDGSGVEHQLLPGSKEFEATVGGMGLTGLITEVCFSLIPIVSPRMIVDTYRVSGLVDLMSTMKELDAQHRYAVAWIDVMSAGAGLGRGVLTAGDHSSESEPLDYRSPRILPVGRLLPPVNLVNRASTSAFNEMWWRKAPRRRIGEAQSIPAFFHPLDGVGGWNRLYGRHGFVQHQICVPDGADEVLHEVVSTWSCSRIPSSLNVLKRFGPGNGRPLSFPLSGWTLTVDVPANGGSALRSTLRLIDDLVLDAGGRHYLAKDSYLRAAAVERGYPELGAWREVRNEMDPHGRWCSELGKRLGLVPRQPAVAGFA